MLDSRHKDKGDWAMRIRDVRAGDYGCQPAAIWGRHRPGLVLSEIRESRRHVGRSVSVRKCGGDVTRRC